MGDELRWLGCGEVDSQHADVYRDSLNTVSSGNQDAGAVVDGFHNADSWIDPTQNLLGRRVHSDPDVHLPAGERRRTEYESRIITAGQPNWSESAAAFVSARTRPRNCAGWLRAKASAA